MRLFHHGAQEAPLRFAVRQRIALLASAFALIGLISIPATASAAAPKVVVIVGPVGSQTANYIRNAKILAAQARSYGGHVIEIYSPNATWSRVKAAAQGANLLIYLGHGNGWPSPYHPFNVYSKDGLGLNAAAGKGNSNTKYYGEYYIRTYIKLAPNSAVLLNRLCYASGNNEWGSGYPSRATAIKRVDNFGYGFLHAGARVVFANAISSGKSVIYNLFKTRRTMAQAFRADGAYDGGHVASYASSRTPGARIILDPSGPGDRYYHSIVGFLGMTATTWR